MGAEEGLSLPLPTTFPPTMTLFPPAPSRQVPEVLSLSWTTAATVRARTICMVERTAAAVASLRGGRSSC